MGAKEKRFAFDSLSHTRANCRIDLLDLFVPFVFSCGMAEWGELTFKVVRLDPAGQEVLARAGNVLVARAAYDMAVSLWGAADIELRQQSRVICSSKPG